MDRVKVLIADDHPLIRQGLVKVIRLDSAIEIVGEAADGEEAVKKAAELRPDVILMDLNMPIVDGLEATRIIKDKFPDIRVIALTVEDSEQKVIKVIRAGVSGYILKDVAPEALISTIRAVCAGEMVIHPKITGMLCREIKTEGITSGQDRKSNKPGEDLQISLTPREAQILKYIAQGVHNKDIARLLYISEKTVKNHITSIFRKLDVEDRTQAVISAVRLKMVNL